MPVDARLRLDLDAMARACAGAGLVFLCNPNNPTGTVHGAGDMKAAIAAMLRDAPQVTVLVDEAYHEYVDDPAYDSLVPLALAGAARDRLPHFLEGVRHGRTAARLRDRTTRRRWNG